MSNFWSGWVIVIALANILGCVWLIWWASRPKKGEAAKGSVTGHTWDDDLQELNNPMPRWWLWLFYITIVFGLAYIIIYPGFGAYKGTAGWTQTGQYEAEMKAAKETYGPIFSAYAKQDAEKLVSNKTAMDSGRRLFMTYCATCHGSDARGSQGYPNLSDNDWIYGGQPEQIKASILDGRRGAMPGFAHLGEKGIEAVSNHVMTLSGRKADADKAAAGKTIFEAQCVACHGADAKGNIFIGAPNLTDKTWLYGSTKAHIIQSVTKGRNGVMPAHREFLGEDKVHLLSAYIYSLSK
ncbi:MAG: cytochrome-c oxidase, cbb3-type subunit III [Gammaproteobacteria bacterium]|nr:cytochrome-c oxidase, cbb3-type subunit III [Gammaproteobacteria bacterium]